MGYKQNPISSLPNIGQWRDPGSPKFDHEAFTQMLEEPVLKKNRERFEAFVADIKRADDSLEHRQAMDRISVFFWEVIEINTEVFQEQLRQFCQELKHRCSVMADPEEYINPKD